MSTEAPAQGQPLDRSARALYAHLRHDLRNPVNAIIGYGEMLVEDAGNTPPDFLSELQALPRLGRDLLEGINTLLDEAQAPPPEVPLDLPALRDSLKARLQPFIDEAVRQCDNLVQRALQLEQGPLVPDLKRIHAAADLLAELLDQDWFTPAATPPAPAAAEPSVPKKAEPESAVASSSHISGHLLIVDDNDFNRDLIIRAVTRQRHTYTEARDGRQALDLIKPHGFDLVLLDVNMPELDGVQVLKRLKADHQLQHIPVIMISGVDEIDTVVRCIEMGAEDYLPKPFDPVLLKARIGACLEKKRLRDQELEYLRNVAALTSAVLAVEAGRFQPQSIDEVAHREDALGKLARMFQNMAREVRAREQRLQEQVEQLQVEIDESHKAKHVAEVTESSYFQSLQDKVRELRRRSPKPQVPGPGG